MGPFLLEPKKVTMASLIQIALRCSRCSGLLRTTIPVHTDVLHPQPTTGSGLTPVSYFSTSPPTLPWIVNRYNSVRVNLTEAVAEGWKLKYLEDFPAMINSRLQAYAIFRELAVSTEVSTY